MRQRPTLFIFWWVGNWRCEETLLIFSILRQRLTVSSWKMVDDMSWLHVNTIALQIYLSRLPWMDSRFVAREECLQRKTHEIERIKVKNLLIIHNKGMLLWSDFLHIVIPHTFWCKHPFFFLNHVFDLYKTWKVWRRRSRWLHTKSHTSSSGLGM